MVITIIINEEELRVRAIKAYQAAKKQAIKRFNQACNIADAIANSYYPSPEVARVFTLLAPKQQEWPPHSLMCSCRRCELNIKTYVKRVMSA